MASNEKQELLYKLVRKRQAAKWEGYSNLADFGYECDFVSPYTKSANNLDASIFVMLQDWSSADTHVTGPNEVVSRLGYTPTLPTNVRLDRLLNEYFGIERVETYATNLFPFIKPGGISARIPRKVLARAAHEFGWPQIMAVRPRLVIALGLETFNALRVATMQPRIGSLRAAIGAPFDHDGIRIWCQAHTGSRGTVNAGGTQSVAENWKFMASWFHDLTQF